MSEHAPGLLKQEPGSPHTIITETGKRVAYCLSYGTDGEEGISPAESEAYAGHMVACWNACAGMNPKAARDLLAACQFMIHTLASFRRSGLTPDPTYAEWATVEFKINAAIAKARKDGG